MKKIILLIHILLFLNLLQACKSQNTKVHNKADSNSNWQSKYHKLKANYSSQWTLITGFDTKDKTLFGVIDKHDGKSYVIKITKDVSKELLSDKDYYDYFKEIMLKENLKNKLLKEHDTLFHDEIFHKFEFLMFTKKWGVIKHHAYVKREDGFLRGIQISFPISENNMQADIPFSLKELDTKIRFGSK